MEEPINKKAINTILILFILWLIVFALSFIMFISTESTGMGFTQGLNRIGVFIGWQFAAFCISIITLIVSRNRKKEITKMGKTLGLIPVGGHLLLILIIVIAVLYVSFTSGQ